MAGSKVPIKVDKGAVGQSQAIDVNPDTNGNPADPRNTPARAYEFVREVFSKYQLRLVKVAESI